MRSLSLFFTIFILLQTVVAKDCQLDQQIKKRVNLGLFKIVPINLFAAEMDEKRAREIYAAECSKEKVLTHEALNCSIFKSCIENECKRTFAPHGSAFLLNDGQSLVTAWHVVYSSHASPLLFLQNYLTNLDEQARNEKLSVLRPAFILMDQSDNIVFDSREHVAESVLYKDKGNPLSTIYSQFGKKGEQAYGFYENIAEDYAYISLPVSIGPALEVGSLRTKECLFSAGHAYDGKTLSFQYAGGKPSSLRELQQRASHYLDFQLTSLPMPYDEFLNQETPEILRHMGYSPEAITQQIEKYDEQILRSSIKTVVSVQQRNMRDQLLDSDDRAVFFHAKVLPGLSGGPLLDNQGKVIGITTNSFYNKTKSGNSPYGGAARLLPKSWTE